MTNEQLLKKYMVAVAETVLANIAGETKKEQKQERKLLKIETEILKRMAKK